jgi:hypothetical protein
MPDTIQKILWILMLALVLAGLGWVMARALKRSDDPTRLVVKWGVTALLAGALFWVLSSGPSVGGAFGVPFLCVLLGVLLSLLWAPSVAVMFSRPITALFDGGLEEAKPQPLYSMAQAKRKRGRLREALYEVQQQLERFPNDFEGQMLMAEIQAEDLKDLEVAQTTILRLCEQPGHTPGNLTAALNRLADWQLKYGLDMEAARRTLQEVIDRFPDSQWSYAATQRLAHLGKPEDLLAAQDRPSVHLTQRATSPLHPVEMPPPPTQDASTAEAQSLVKQLEQFPEDNDARERLAALYAHHYRRLDLAAAELEQLIAQTNAPARKVAHWLNLLADWQIEVARDEEGARQTLQRIVDLFPDHAAASLASQRQSCLKLELRKSEAARSVQLGTYEQDIGLRMRRPGPTGDLAEPSSPR